MIKYGQNRSFEVGLLKWMGAIDKRLDGLSSYSELLEKGLLIVIVELTLSHKQRECFDQYCEYKFIINN